MAMAKDIMTFAGNKKLLTANGIVLQECDEKFMEMLWVFPTDKLKENIDILVSNGYKIVHKTYASLLRVITAEPTLLSQTIQNIEPDSPKTLRSLKTVKEELKNINAEEITMVEVEDKAEDEISFGGK